MLIIIIVITMLIINVIQSRIQNELYRKADRRRLHTYTHEKRLVSAQILTKLYIVYRIYTHIYIYIYIIVSIACNVFD